MSYILDALRRAEAERQRGQVPGLGAQTTPAAADSDAPRRLPVAAWVAAALLAGVALLALGWWLRPPAPASTGVAPPVAVSAPAAAPSAPTAVAVAALPLVVAAPPVAAPPPPSLPSVATQAAPPPEPPPAVARTAPPAVAPAAAAPASAPLALAALSADLRRQLPPLALGGSIWSESAAQRFIIVNGQIVREGDAAAPGVVVERIGPRSAVLRWRELRIEWPL